ncbi:MAG: hypothetical protein KDE08_07875 [Rhodobacteraceae bacterium]|nr:hypothetical protein [Paracoccaceae bacterium]
MNDRWLAVLSRITPFVPDDLDAVIMPDSPTAAAPDGVFLASIAPAPTPSSRLWDRVENEQSYLGIRLTAPHPNAAEAAIRLASAALERGIVPIILSRIDTSGFERFGFRVERVTGLDAAECSAAEAELMRFWNMAIVIDAADVAALG